MHSYAEPAHEAAIRDILARRLPGVPVTLSSEVCPEIREYERTSTAITNAYVQPLMDDYLAQIQAGLADIGFRGAFYPMLSSGGTASVHTASAIPVQLVESGPAAGAMAAAHFGELSGRRELISFDMGGTTAKASLVENGQPVLGQEFEFRDGISTPSRFVKGAGYMLKVPAIDIAEVGSGGGSIARIDAGGLLVVGPESAGGDPGPACYGRGNARPTVTDANMALGLLNPRALAGGSLAVDPERSRAAIQAEVAGPLGIDVTAAAHGIRQVANVNMARAIRAVTVERGRDPRGHALMAFGGGGPMHAVALAEELKIPEVIVPVNSSVFSAWGMLLTDLRRDYVHTHLLPLTPENAPAALRQFRDMEAEAAANVSQDGIALGDTAMSCEHFADMRYQGQEHTVKVPVAIGAQGIDLAATIDRFHAAHQKRYTYRLPNPVQIANFHVIARVAVPKPDLPRQQATGRKLGDTLIGRRIVDFDAHGVHDAAIYDGLRLEPGMELEGPAIVQEPMVTLVVPPGNKVSTDEFGSYHVHLRQS